MSEQTSGWTHASAARLAAVQALYEIDVGGAPVEVVLKSFTDERWASILSELEHDFEGSGDPPLQLPLPNRRMLRSIVHGVLGSVSALDEMIAGRMSSAERFEQLEAIARAILRAAAYELGHSRQVPVGTITADYVAIANSFFAENQPNMINAVVDGLAARLREPEMDADLAG